ncbi:MAG: hypothetical protein PHR77_04835 [Kiritimatiellae bacterium]|nr:hypothetical protein [Kiritimatiellia bacterium]MDD5519859.1 hypothetical protein [Kiritimatiellia bacterium]
MLKQIGTILFAIVLCAFSIHAADTTNAAAVPNFDSLRMVIQDLGSTFPLEYEGVTLSNEFKGLESEYRHIQNQADRDAFAQKYEAFSRRVLLSNPLLIKNPVLFVVRRQYKPDHHNTETMFQTGEINTKSFQGGGALKVIDFKKGGDVRTLLAVEKGVIRDPDVHFDGRKILFSMRKDIDDNYHIYEINSDGTGLRQITSAKGVFDIDPIYLPDESIVFSSSREPKFCMCNRHIMGNLFRMDSDGANIHQISKNTLHDGHGWLMSDGRIMYDRWEYVDRNFGDAQGLWTVNPDGTQHLIYWKNNTGSPGVALDGHDIPETQQLLCVFSSCHDRPWGALALVDRRLGLDGRPPVVRTWPADAVNLINVNGSFDAFRKVKLKFEDPYPLSSKYFICSRMTGKGEEMGLYLVDIFGNEILLHVEEPACFDPVPLAPRHRPPVIPSKRDYENKEGVLFVQNVYLGTHMEGVKPDTVKFLRVIESGEKRSWSHPCWFGQGAEAPGMNWHDFGNKKILGTVPVEDDGSACFSVPSDRFIFFQLLDKNYMMIQSMRSGMVVQSGERTGCIGCHDERRSAPPLAKADTLKALKREPSRLEGWNGPPRFFNYITEVQPVFDKHCVSCHDFDKPDGKVLNLSRDRGMIFNVSYHELWTKKQIKVVGAGPAEIQQAYSWGSHASRLVGVLAKEHGEVKLTREEKDRIITWVDLNAPYYPEFDTNFPNNLYGRAPLSGQQVKRLFELTGVNCDERKHAMDVCFDRPEVSPCLDKFSDRNDPVYKEALAIIAEGKKILTENPSAEMANFKPCEDHQKRQDKYTVRLAIEQRNREAIRTGKKLYDKDIN